MACIACEGKRFLIVNVNNTRRLRIERCDECSDNTLADTDVRKWPAAIAALESARAEQRRTDPVTGLLKEKKKRAKRTPSDMQFVAAARRLYMTDEVQVTDDPSPEYVSRPVGGDGAFVAAWVWVANDDARKEKV